MSLIETYSNATYTKNYHPVSSAYENQRAAAEKGDADMELFWSLQTATGGGDASIPKPWDSENEELFGWKAEELEGVLGRIFSSSK